MKDHEEVTVKPTPKITNDPSSFKKVNKYDSAAVLCWSLKTWKFKTFKF